MQIKFDLSYILIKKKEFTGALETLDVLRPIYKYSASQNICGLDYLKGITNISLGEFDHALI